MTHTPGPWEVWFEYDRPAEQGGLIVRGGVDSAGRHAGIAELLTENVESADNDVPAANRQIIGDLRLIAAAPELLVVCREFLDLHQIAAQSAHVMGQNATGKPFNVPIKFAQCNCDVCKMGRAAVAKVEAS